MKKKGTRTQHPPPHSGPQSGTPRAHRPAGDEEFIPLRQAVEERQQPLHEECGAAGDRAKASSPQEQRAERVRQLKQQVADGSYNPDLRRVAQILLYDDTDALLGG